MPQIYAAAGVSEPLVATLPRALKPRHSYSDSFAPTQFATLISAPAVRASPFPNNSILPEILYTNGLFHTAQPYFIPSIASAPHGPVEPHRPAEDQVHDTEESEAGERRYEGGPQGPPEEGLAEDVRGGDVHHQCEGRDDGKQEPERAGIGVDGVLARAAPAVGQGIGQLDGFYTVDTEDGFDHEQSQDQP